MGLDEAPPSLLLKGAVFFPMDFPEVQHFTNGGLGLLASPPGDAISLCGPPTYDQPCTSENAGVAWNWNADDLDDGPDPSSARVGMIDLVVGIDPQVTVCWDEDGEGPAESILVVDDSILDPLCGYNTVPPLISGRITAFAGGGVSCGNPGSARVVARLDLPVPSPVPGTLASLPAGSVGKILLIGQVTDVPSSAGAGAQILLLPRTPLP
jgi:hypothetical protein